MKEYRYSLYNLLADVVAGQKNVFLCGRTVTDCVITHSVMEGCRLVLSKN